MPGKNSEINSLPGTFLKTVAAKVAVGGRLFQMRAGTKRLFRSFSPVYTIQLVVKPVKLNVCIHDAIGCQTGCQTCLTTGCIAYTNIQPVVRLTTGLTTGCIMYTVGCQTSFTTG